MWASLAGLFLLLLSRIICTEIADTSVGEILLGIKDRIAPFPYMGTAAGTLLLAGFLTLALNCLIPASEAGLWVYHAGKLDKLESVLLSSALGVRPTGRMGYPTLFIRQLWLDLLRTCKRWSDFVLRRSDTGGYSCFDVGEPQLLMITLGDNKVYVGFVSQLPPVSASELSYVRILPVWSGYRDKDDRRVYRTTNYDQAVLESKDRELLIKLVPAKEIMAAGIHVDGTFPIQDIAPSNGYEDAGWKPVLRRAMSRDA